MNKISAIFNLLRQGGEVTNAAAWKNRATVANLLVAVVAAIAAFGFRLQLDADTLTDLAGGIVALVAVVNSVMHVITDQRVGLSPGAGTSPEIGSSVGTESAAPDIRDPGGA